MTVDVSGTVSSQAYTIYYAGLNTTTSGGVNVGIGTTSPITTLDVNGEIALNSQLYVFAGSSRAAGQHTARITTDGTDSFIKDTYLSTGGTYGKLHFQTNDTTRMTILPTSGNVGIGTTTPTEKFMVVGSDAVAVNAEIINSNTAGYTTLALGEADSGGTYGLLGRVGSTDTPGANIYQIPKMFFLYNSDQAGGDLGLGATATDGNIRFFTSSVVAATGERMRIDSTGKVGIGTTSPQSLLHTTLSDAATSAVSETRRIEHLTSGTAAAGFGSRSIWYLEDAAGNSEDAAAIDAAWEVATNGSEESSLRFLTSDNGTLGEKMRIDDDGNVGIGTTTPKSGYKLDVNGHSVIARALTSAGGGDVELFSEVETTGFEILQRGTAAGGNLGLGVGSVELTHFGVGAIGIYNSGTTAADYIAFGTGGSLAGNERMRIGQNGNIGIGSTGPDRKLDILDVANPQLRLTQADGSVYADLQMTSGGDLTMAVDGQSNQ
ncbi:MAG: hypothetical protein AAB692_04240, partial [Patescibacteria group bacterium]